MEVILKWQMSLVVTARWKNVQSRGLLNPARVASWQWVKGAMVLGRVSWLMLAVGHVAGPGQEAQVSLKNLAVLHCGHGCCKQTLNRLA